MSTRRVGGIERKHRLGARRFDDPIALPDGRVLRTLRDAGNYVAAFPKTKHARPEWRLAAAMLMQTEEDGAPVMLAAAR
jgi:hypothetical protein